MSVVETTIADMCSVRARLSLSATWTIAVLKGFANGSTGPGVGELAVGDIVLARVAIGSDMANRRRRRCSGCRWGGCLATFLVCWPPYVLEVLTGSCVWCVTYRCISIHERALWMYADSDKFCGFAKLVLPPLGIFDDFKKCHVPRS